MGGKTYKGRYRVVDRTLTVVIPGYPKEATAWVDSRTHIESLAGILLAELVGKSLLAQGREGTPA